MRGSSVPERAQEILRSPGYWVTVWRRFLRDPVALLAALVVLGLILMAVFAPWIAPQDPFQGMSLQRLKPPGTEGYPLGTDELGRDMLSRLIHGARISLFMGIVPVLCALAIGAAIGVVAGYSGGWTNTLLMRTVDVFFAFPSVLLAVALAGALGPGLFNGLIALTLVFIPPIARVAESVTTGVRTRDYVEAAKASGAGALLIIRKHVLGNVLGPIFVYAMSLIAVSMILAAGLSFLGLGVKPPQPDWGLMLNTLRTAMYTQPLLCALPGVMIFITSIAFNLMTDGLRSAMDIKT
ncbi:MAG: ABC transporter permease [Xanthobacteraceae bacterium]|nr:ABC transporter permease [Xanthobacteraceae bacterium]